MHLEKKKNHPNHETNKPPNLFITTQKYRMGFLEVMSDSSCKIFDIQVVNIQPVPQSRHLQLLLQIISKFFWFLFWMQFSLFFVFPDSCVLTLKLYFLKHFKKSGTADMVVWLLITQQPWGSNNSRSSESSCMVWSAPAKWKHLAPKTLML